MQNEPDTPVTPVVQLTEHTPAPSPRSSIAPWWNTLLVLALVFLNSYAGSSHLPRTSGSAGRILLYSGTLVFELILLIVVWFGVRQRGTTLRQLIGGRWDTVEDFLLDVGIAIMFFLLASAVNVALRVALGVLNLHNMAQQAGEINRTLGPLIPRTLLELSVFVLLSVFAGVIEEIIFRGYLQQQFAAWGRSIWIGILLSAVAFGAGHGYQGKRMMIVIGVYGALFGILAHLRKSLRPGILAHAFQDSYSGVALFFLTRKGIF